MEAIREIFIEVQRSTQTHKLCVKKLAALVTSNRENVSFILKGGVDRILLHPAGGAYVDRSISFLGAFLTALEDDILNVAMDHICARLQSSNKLVRQRVCQIVNCTIQCMVDAKLELSERLFGELSNCMSARLKDKVPAVRVAAMKTLKFLQSSEDPNDESTIAIKRALHCDTSSAVRVAAVEALYLTDDSKMDLCNRLKDVKSDVRVAVLQRLSNETDCRQFTSNMRAEILRTALEDREEAVRTAVLQLVMKWLSLVDDGNVPKFLHLLNPVENEEAALLVGATIMEELSRSESPQLAKMKKSLKDCYFKWNALASSGCVTSLTPSDVLWVHIRCSYARQFMPVFPASEMCDALLPDAAVLCTLLKDIKASLVNPLEHHAKQSGVVKAQQVSKYLHNLAPLLIGNTDVSGLSQLKAECTDTFLNTGISLPWEAVESALRAFVELHAAVGTDATRPHLLVLDLAASMRRQIAVLTAEQAEDTPEAERALNPEVVAKLLQGMTERCLQLTRWALQQELGVAASRVSAAADAEAERTELDVVKEVLPFVLESLQKPQWQCREQAVGCLGLIALVDPSLCDAYRGLLVQIASADFDHAEVRKQALQCLVDFAVVYREKYADDSELANVLLRMQNSEDPDAMLVAAEAATKLLHAGAQHEPRLFANLLKFFFLTESLPDAAAANTVGGEEDDPAVAQEMFERRIFLCECARLQQTLSIFFHVFTTSEVIADGIVADSVQYLVADMTSEIKDGTVDATALSKILKHLLSLCENKPAPSAVSATNDDGTEADSAAATTSTTLLNRVQACAAAALCKELLKLDTSKVAKAVDKEYIKLLASLNLQDWIALYDATAVERALDTIALCNAHDRTSAKHLEQLMQICATPSIHVEHSSRSAVAFADLVPGLADLIELTARSSTLDMSMDEGASFYVDDASVGGGTQSMPGSAVKPKRVARTPLSALKSVPRTAPATTAPRASARQSARSTRARMSYAEQASASEDSSEEDEDAEDPSASESEAASEGEASDAEVQTPAAEEVRNAAMSPTKKFIGRARGRAAPKSIDTAPSKRTAAAAKKTRGASRTTDENVVVN